MRKVCPKEGNFFSQVQTVYISSELGFLGSRRLFTHHFILCHSSYPIRILLPLLFNNVSQCPEREERMEEVILKPLRSKVPPRGRDVRLSLDSWWSRGLQRILQGWVMLTIRGNAPDWINRRGSHCPPLKAGFSKHT